ncbi:MAG: hypothetical protein MAG431_01859 [Chloroflexi bacterium]|nr:hypothetical protein [Chloroflexota bacterium]
MREYFTAYLMIAPATILVFLFGIFPVGFALFVSLHKWRIKRGDFKGRDFQRKFIVENRYISPFVVIFSMSIILLGCSSVSLEKDVEPIQEIEKKTTAEGSVESFEEEPRSTRTPISEFGEIEISDLRGISIEVWQVLNYRDHSEGMIAIVDNFNTENEWEIFVELRTYKDTEIDILDVGESDDFPDAILSNSVVLVEWYADDQLVDITPYINDSVVGLIDEEQADFYQYIFDGAMAADKFRVGFPLNQTINVLFYNETWAQELGFENPPQTSFELRQQACAAAAYNNSDDDPSNDGTGGLVLYPSATNIMSWLFAYGDDGLTDDGAAYDFTSESTEAVATIWKEMWDEGCAFATDTYPNPEFATRQALFIMSSNVEIPYLDRAFDIEGATEDEWTMIPFVGPDGTKAVNADGQYFGIVDTTPERKLATWLFLKYLSTPEVQAERSSLNAFYPVRKRAKDILEEYKIEKPHWGSGLDLLMYGRGEPFRVSWQPVRRFVHDAFKYMLQGSTEDIPMILGELNETAAELDAEAE